MITTPRRAPGIGFPRGAGLVLIVFAPLAACAGVGARNGGDDGGTPDGGPSPDGGTLPVATPCTAGSRICSPAGVPRLCDTSGTWQDEAACSAGSRCQAGECVRACDTALASRSYVGCEYWASPTSNIQLGIFLRDPASPSLGAVGAEGFPFAVALANPGEAPAAITIAGGALRQALSLSIPAGQTQVMRLPWVQELVGAPAAGALTLPPTGTRVVGRGAYHIQSDAPVVAYQFNPLTFTDQRKTGCSPADPEDQLCFSFSNDASLLLPVHTLGTRYTVLSWPTQALFEEDLFVESPGFVAVVATAPGDTQVSVTLSAYALAGVATTEVLRPGELLTRTLRQGDVLQIHGAGQALVSTIPCQREALFEDPALPPTEICRPERAADLTGTVVEASAPVSVFAGHDCAFVPYNRMACDHLEEQLFPDATWGTRYVVSPTAPQLSPREPSWVRVLSAVDGNQIVLTPPVSGAPPTLGKGEHFDFATFDGAVVEGTGPLAVVQYLVGQQYWSNDLENPTPGADPAMVLEVPIEQWRSRYDFYVPSTYVTSFVNLVVPPGVEPVFDGGPLPVFSRYPLGPFEVLQVDLSSRTGPHRLEAGEPFAIKVYGFAPFTSYVYPGGLDLRPLVVD